jgi:hypothetical protein
LKRSLNTLLALTLLITLMTPQIAYASLASDMADFKARHSSIYNRIDPAMAVLMDRLVQDVYNDTIANYDPAQPSFDQVNRHAARRLVRDPNYEGLLDYIAAQVDDPRNADVKAQLETLLDEICTIVARAVDAALNVKPGTGITVPPGTRPIPGIPTGPVTFTPTPAQLEEIRGHWAESQLQRLITMGIICGDERGFINADAQITRAQFSSMLVRALHLGNTPIIRSSFRDVTADSWYFFAVHQAAQAGIVNGYGADLFGPDDPITREQIAVMIVNAMRHQGLLSHDQDGHASIIAPFADRHLISGWASHSVSLAVEYKLIEVWNGEILAPQNPVSRAEAGVIILNLLDLIAQANTGMDTPVSEAENSDTTPE